MFRMVTVTPPLRGSGEPLLPGGYEVGEKVFFTGASQTLSNGDKVMHGQQGKATGPAIFRAHPSTQGCTVRFPGNKGNINCDLTMVPPPRRRHCYPPPDPYTRDADRSRLLSPFPSASNTLAGSAISEPLLLPVTSIASNILVGSLAS